MRKIAYIMTLLLATLTSAAQDVVVEARIDSVAIMIGEQIGVTFTVSAPDNLPVVFPTFKPREELTPGVEIVTVEQDDTTHSDNRQTIARKILLTSFDEDAYKLPAQTIRVGQKEYQTNPLALKVLTVDVDTTNFDRFFPPKDVQGNPFQWSEWRGLYEMSILLFVLIVIGLYLYMRYKQNKPIISRILVVRHIPPHQKALTAIEKIKQDRHLATDDQKLYYTRLTDALRQYIQERFGFSAMEMTSAEIIANLQQVGDAKMLDELTELFATSDLVKFAKHSALINENDLNLVNAINFIDQTKTQEHEREERIVPKMSDNDRRLQQSRTIIRILISVIALAVLGILVWVGYKMMTIL